MALALEDKGTDRIPRVHQPLPIQLLQSTNDDGQCKSSCSGQASYVTLGKSFNLSDPYYSHWEK